MGRFFKISQKNPQEVSPEIQAYIDAIFNAAAKNKQTPTRVVKTPKMKIDAKDGMPSTKVDSPLSEQQRKLISYIGYDAKDKITFDATGREMLWREYKNHLTPEQFDKMINDKIKNINEQKIKDQNAPPILEFGEGGKRMVKADSYPRLDSKTLDQPFQVNVQGGGSYQKKRPHSRASWNPKGYMNLRSDDLEPAAHELRHVLHDITANPRANKNLYKDYDTKTKLKHMNPAYVGGLGGDGDSHQTGHHLVDLGELHKLYVSHGNDPIANDQDTDRFMKWYKDFVHLRKNDKNPFKNYYKGYLFELNPNDPNDEKFLRRNMKMVVDKPIDVAKDKTVKMQDRHIENKVAHVGKFFKTADDYTGNKNFGDTLTIEGKAYVMEHSTRKLSGGVQPKTDKPYWFKLHPVKKDGRVQWDKPVKKGIYVRYALANTQHQKALAKKKKGKTLFSKLFKTSEYNPSGKVKPYTPKPVQELPSAAIPNIRPNQIKGTDLLTTKSTSALDTDIPKLSHVLHESFWKIALTKEEIEAQYQESLVDDSDKEENNTTPPPKKDESKEPTKQEIIAQKYIDKDWMPDENVDKDTYLRLGGKHTKYWDDLEASNEDPPEQTEYLTEPIEVEEEPADSTNIKPVPIPKPYVDSTDTSIVKLKPIGDPGTMTALDSLYMGDWRKSQTDSIRDVFNLEALKVKPEETVPDTTGQALRNKIYNQRKPD